MTRGNRLSILRPAITIVLAAFFFYLPASGKAANYVHPRMFAFLGAAAVLLALLALVQVRAVFHSGSRPAECMRSCHLSCLVFLLPLVVFLASNRSGLDANLAAKKGISPGTGFYRDERPQRQERRPENRDLVFREETYSRQLEALYTEVDRFTGKRVVISGFAFRPDGLGDDEFYVARYLISCCAADALVVGVLCRTNGVACPENNAWVEVGGTVVKTKAQGHAIPMIEADRIDNPPKPASPYIY